MRPACVLPFLAVVASSVALTGPGVAAADPSSIEGTPCSAHVADEPYAVPPGPTSTTALGPQPAAYELRAPAGRPRGVAVVIHGGGWVDVGRARLGDTVQEVEWWLSQGWAVANVDYRACDASLPDVLGTFDAIRLAVGPATPIVVAGESAGAHLALMVDARRDDVDVVVAKAGPTNAATLADGHAYDPDRKDMSSTLPELLANVWRGAFGPSWITDFSPVQQAAHIGARVLFARPTQDPIIADDQGPELADALRAAHPEGWVRTLELESEPGDVWFSHALVSNAAEARFRAAELEAVAPWQTGPSAAPPVVAGWWDATETEDAPTGGLPAGDTPAGGPAAGAGSPAAATTGPGAGSPGPTTEPDGRTPPAGSALWPWSWPTPATAPAAAAPPTRRLTAAQVRGAARAGVLARFRYRRTPRRYVATCSARSATVRRCTVSWTASRWRYRGTVDVPVVVGTGLRTTLRVVRTDPAGRRRVFRAG